MAEQRTSPTLLERLRDAGDQAAWSRFQDTYGDLILRYGLARGLQTADAEDVRQLTFVKLMQSLERFRYDGARGRFRDYLFAVVRSAVASHMGAKSGRPAGEVDLEGVAAGPGAELWQREWEQFHFRRAWEAVRGQFESRSLDAFQCLLDGQPMAEVAARFAMTEQGLHKVKQRVRDGLRERIEAQVAQEDGG